MKVLSFLGKYTCTKMAIFKEGAHKNTELTVSVLVVSKG